MKWLWRDAEKELRKKIFRIHDGHLLLTELDQLRTEVKVLKRDLRLALADRNSEMRARLEAEENLVGARRRFIFEVCMALNISLSDFPDFDRDD